MALPLERPNAYSQFSVYLALLRLSGAAFHPILLHCRTLSHNRGVLFGEQRSFLFFCLIRRPKEHGAQFLSNTSFRTSECVSKALKRSWEVLAISVHRHIVADSLDYPSPAQDAPLPFIVVQGQPVPELRNRREPRVANAATDRAAAPGRA